MTIIAPELSDTFNRLWKTVFTFALQEANPDLRAEKLRSCAFAAKEHHIVYQINKAAYAYSAVEEVFEGLGLMAHLNVTTWGAPIQPSVQGPRMA